VVDDHRAGRKVAAFASATRHHRLSRPLPEARTIPNRRRAGHLLLSINGVDQGGLTSLDNGLGRIDSVQWGLLGGTATASSGRLQVDQFSSSD
jgi:hypothetical protein